MDYKDYFGPYASEVNEYLKEFFKTKISDASRITPIGADLWKNLETFIEGGKRMRAGLVKLGYEIGGGKDFEAILPISAAVEIMHGAILVHDDIIDQDEMRHGRSTVHKVYEKELKGNYESWAKRHYGISMAMMVGDAGLYEATVLITTSNFSDEYKNRAVRHFHRYMLDTVYGEALDIDLAYRETITEEEVELINSLKTAEYSIIGPLGLGLILAGKKEEELSAIREYGLPGGLAFQIQDDILGLFGDVEKSGKSNTSDIKEGKNTLLFTQAIKLGDKDQKERLQSLWGNRDITDNEAEEVRHIIKDCGALEYVQDLAYKYADKGKGVVTKVTQDRELQEVLSTLADFVVKRDK